MAEFGLSVRSNYSDIPDDELDRLITKIHYHHPNCGYRLMQVHLATPGHRVQQEHIREAMLRTDPNCQDGGLQRTGGNTQFQHQIPYGILMEIIV